MMEAKKNSVYFNTYTGLKIHPLSPSPEEICIEDIAHALSNTCRFSGHCSEFYSVAQHSVYVSARVIRQNGLWGLLHDAAEAYISDIVGPLKHTDELVEYRMIERKIMKAITRRFKIPFLQPKEVKEMCTALMVTEARDLGLLTNEFYGPGVEPLKIKIRPQKPENAEQSFLEWFEVVTSEPYRGVPVGI